MLQASEGRAARWTLIGREGDFEGIRKWNVDPSGKGFPRTSDFGIWSIVLILLSHA